jgi:hypothetical protein
MRIIILSIALLFCAFSAQSQVLKSAGVWYFLDVDSMTARPAVLPNGTELAYVIGTRTLYKWNRGSSAWEVNSSGGLTMPFDSITFTPSNVAPDTAELKYSSDYETFVFGADGTTIEIGQKEAWYVKNQTGSTINKGTVVRASGTLGSSGRILISPMVIDGTVSSKYLLGIAASNIANGSDGYVIDFGKLRKFNTAAWADGAVLYAGAGGTLTATEPSPPNLRLPIAFVVHSHATNGVLAIRIQTGNELHELHDVDTTGINTGEGLVYNSTLHKWQASAGKLITAVDTASMLANYVDGSGTATRIPILTGTRTIGNSNALYNSSTKRWTWDSPSVLELPMGTDAQRPSPATTSDFWYNMTGGGLEWYNSTRWAKALESTFNRGTSTYVPFFDANGQITENAFLSMLGATAAIQIPVGTTAQRPTVAAGLIRTNSTTQSLEFGNNAAGSGGTWVSLARANNPTGDFTSGEVTYGAGVGSRLNTSSSFTYASGVLQIVSGSVGVNNSPTGSTVLTALDLARTAGSADPTVGSGIGILFRRRSSGGAFGNNHIAHKIYAYNTGTGVLTSGFEFLTHANVTGSGAASVGFEIIGDAIGVYTANTITSSSALQVNSTTKGMLPPRWTAAQRIAISSPTTGLFGYQTDGTEGMYIKAAAGFKRLLWDGDAATTWLKTELEAGRDVNINGASSTDFTIQNTRVQFDGKFKVGSDSTFVHNPATDTTFIQGDTRIKDGNLTVQKSSGTPYVNIISTATSGDREAGIYIKSRQGFGSVIEFDNATTTPGSSNTGNVLSFYNYKAAPSGAVIAKFGSLIGNYGAVFLGGIEVKDSLSNNVMQVQKDRVVLNQYGSGTKEAADLSKTESVYNAIYATDGTLLEKRANTEQYNAITSTTSPVTLSSTIADNLINQGLTQATFTFRLPASPVDGQISKATFGNAVTALTIDGNGTTVTGTLPTAATVGTQIIFKNYTGLGWVRQL